MKILVTVKRVTDYEAKIRVKSDGSGIEDGVNMIINPFDEIAVEEALRLKEKHSGEVIVLSIGTKDSVQQIRSALAMGGDRGILVNHDGELDSWGVAGIISKIVDKESPDVVLMGKQAIDGDNNQSAQLLAEFQGWGQATFANTITIEGEKATVAREADGGLQTVEVDLPCVITADLRLNEPRYASLPGIMKAKRKPLEEIPAGDLGVDLAPKVIIKSLEAPAEKSAGQIVADVDALVEKLQNEAKAL
ncbi:MAG: electron transfer flavoprotein subunit beta/FixA family protein [Deltaproteobacteria bacterium]|nr:electron transfer flavoprotein subunit beta/FixA family protein [Deltaproteobacteria bacterium]